MPNKEQLDTLMFLPRPIISKVRFPIINLKNKHIYDEDLNEMINGQVLPNTAIHFEEILACFHQRQ